MRIVVLAWFWAEKYEFNFLLQKKIYLEARGGKNERPSVLNFSDDLLWTLLLFKWSMYHNIGSLIMKLEVQIEKFALLFLESNKILIIQSMVLRHRYTFAISIVIHFCLLHRSVTSEDT